MIKKLNDDLFFIDIILVHEDSNYVTFVNDEIDILSADIINIKLDNVKFDEDDPEIINYSRLMA